MAPDPRPETNAAPMSAVEVDVPAKVNLGLKILRRRPDGYHDLDTVFQAVSLFDTISVFTTPPPPGVYTAPDGLWLQVESPWSQRPSGAV